MIGLFLTIEIVGQSVPLHPRIHVAQVIRIALKKLLMKSQNLVEL